MSSRLFTFRAARWVLLVALTDAGCSVDDVIATVRCAGSVCDVPLPGFCSEQGPMIAGAQDASLCGGKLLASSLPSPLCVCGMLSGGDLQLDSFDSAVGPYQAGSTGGDVGVVGGISPQGSWNIGGALRSSSATTAQVLGTLWVRGPLSLAGDLSGDTVRAAADAEIGGNISLVNLSVMGTLTTPSGSTTSVTGQRAINQARSAAVQVAPPCPCDLDPYVSGPMLAIQAASQTSRLGLDQNALEGYAGSPVLNLSCGRYYFQRVSGLGSLSIQISGRVELAIGGGLSVGNALTISLAEGAQLDLYVHGDVEVGGVVAIGDPSSPPRVRFFAGGVDSISLAGGGFIGAVLMGRRRAVSISSPLDFYGGLIVDSLSLNSLFRVHYDQQILNLTGSCPSQ